jgi:hypothetical protein
MLQIFISSSPELQSERKAVESVFDGMTENAFSDLKYSSSEPSSVVSPAAEAGRLSPEAEKDIGRFIKERGEVFVGVFSSKGTPDHVLKQYQLAVNEGLACFIYLKQDDEANSHRLEIRTSEPPLDAVFTHYFDSASDLGIKVASDLSAWLQDNCDFILHGHLHNPAMSLLSGPDSGAMVVAGGAGFETRNYPNAYNFVRLDLAKGTGSVHLLRYTDKRGGFWGRDTLLYRNVPNGVYEFALPAKISNQPS